MYGSDYKFRRFLEDRARPYVVAVTSRQRLWVGFEQYRIDAIADTLTDEAWFRLSVADGSKGPRVYDWAAVLFGYPTDEGHQRHLLVRRHPRTGERAYSFCTPPATNARDLATAAGQRWAIECCVESPSRRPAWTSTRCGRGPAGTAT